MDKFFSDMVLDMSTKVNKEVVKGLTRRALKVIPEKLMEYGKSSLTGLESILTLDSITAASPEKSYNLSTVAKKPVYQHDKSDLYYLELKFLLYGEPIPSTFVMVPFTEDGVSFYLNGVRYGLAQILTDHVISVEKNGLFVKPSKGKLNFLRTYHPIFLNGTLVSNEVVYSPNMFASKDALLKKTKKRGTPVAPLLLYSLINRGFKDTCAVFDVEILLSKKGVFDKEKYDTLSSTGNAPSNLKSVRNLKFIRHQISIGVKKGTLNGEKLGTSILYMFDVHPNLADGMVKIITTGPLDKEKELWKVVLSQMLLGDDYNGFRAGDLVQSHLTTLSDFLDKKAKNELAIVDINVQNFFELLEYFIKNLTTMVTLHKENKEDIFAKYYELHYYILFSQIIGFNKIAIEISRKASKGIVSAAEVKTLLDTYLSTKAIYKIRSSLAAFLITHNNDNTFLEINSKADIQQRGKGVQRATSGRGKTVLVPDEFLHLNGASAVYSTVSGVKKSVPTSFMNLNPYIPLNPVTGGLVIDDDFRETVTKIDAEIRGLTVKR